MRGRIIAAASCVLALAACQQQPASPSALGPGTLSAAGSVGAPTTTMGQHEQDVPIKGTASGMVIYDPANPNGCAAVPGQPFAITTRSEATGELSHLGLTVYHGAHCQTAQGQIGTVTFIAANGNELHATYVTFKVSPGPLVVGEYFEIGGEVTFSGGTGRFIDATGTGTMHARVLWDGFADLESPATFTWEGRIKY